MMVFRLALRLICSVIILGVAWVVWSPISFLLNMPDTLFVVSGLVSALLEGILVVVFVCSIWSIPLRTPTTTFEGDD